jgi:hypothetical protein
MNYKRRKAEKLHTCTHAPNKEMVREVVEKTGQT